MTSSEKEKRLKPATSAQLQLRRSCLGGTWLPLRCMMTRFTERPILCSLHSTAPSNLYQLVCLQPTLRFPVRGLNSRTFLPCPQPFQLANLLGYVLVVTVTMVCLCSCPHPGPV